MSATVDPKEVARRPLPRDAAARNGQAGPPAADAATRAEFWRASAPAPLRDGQLAADAAWQVYCTERKQVRPIARLCRTTENPLAWGLDPAALDPVAQRLAELLSEMVADGGSKKFAKEKKREELRAALRQWLDGAGASPVDISLALASLSAAHLLAAAGDAVEGRLAWELVDFLSHLSAEAVAVPPVADATREQFVAEQLLAVELPLTLAHLFRDMAPVHALAKPAERRLTETLADSLNGQGLPPGRYVGALRLLAACWTRCRAIGEATKRGRWSKLSQRQYRWVVRQALRWTAPDGTPLLAAEPAPAWTEGFLRTALRLSGKEKDAAAAIALLGKDLVGKSLASARKPSPTADNCDWSCLATMRSDWSPDAAVVAVDYSGDKTLLDVWAGGRQLFRGAWTWQSHAGGDRLEAVGPWEELCWFSDKDVNYLELSRDLAGGTRLERQIILARREKFLLLVDHLKPPEGEQLRHDFALPLGPSLLFCGEGETRDALLVDGRPIARLIPLALPEWRIDPRGGELSTTEDGAVRLSQHAAGRTMACPLFVDLDAERAAQPSTWRQLTVVDLLVLQPAEVAVAYRIQCGGRQWAYYRAQSAMGNRTFLGQNTSSECVVARFLPKTGEIKTIVEIEG